MRFEHIELESLDTNLGNGEYDGNYVVPATDELIEITNKIRENEGMTDLVSVDCENDVYYTHYLTFNIDKKDISLYADVAHGEKDDYKSYIITLTPEEKEMLLWKVVNQLMADVLNAKYTF
jgi:hypothetical protein